MKHDSSGKLQFPCHSNQKLSDDADASPLRSYFLHAGEVHVSSQGGPIFSIVGSCVMVCIWDPVKLIGGATHYLLPTWDGLGNPSPRYGNVAIPMLLDKLREARAQRAHLRAKVFGGGCMFEALRWKDSKDFLGNRNMEVALKLLEKERIPVVSVEVGGARGQRIFFQPNTGGSTVTNL